MAAARHGAKDETGELARAEAQVAETQVRRLGMMESRDDVTWEKVQPTFER